MKQCQTINLQEPQRNRNATEKYVNLIMTSTVRHIEARLMGAPSVYRNVPNISDLNRLLTKLTEAHKTSIT